jgi:phage/plasmid primase-like uncharacterized protein
MRAASPGELLDSLVLPALFERLDVAFPEFGWRRTSRGWQATNDQHTRLVLGCDARRVACQRPQGFFDVGSSTHTTWVGYVAGEPHPTGAVFVDAVKALAERAGVELGLGDASPEAVERREASRRALADRAERDRVRAEKRAADEDSRRLDIARRICEDSLPGADLAAAYLGTRMAVPSPAACAGVRLWRWSRDGSVWLVLPVRDAAGELVGVHRIRVEPDGRAWVGPDGRKDKRSLGPIYRRRGAFAIGSPDAVGTVIACEGWETGAALHAATGLPVLVCLSTTGLKVIDIPQAWREHARRVIIAADLDRSGAGAVAAERAVAICAEAGLIAGVAMPGVGEMPEAFDGGVLRDEVGGLDWLDVVAAGRVDAVRAAIDQAVAQASGDGGGGRSGGDDDGGSEDSDEGYAWMREMLPSQPLQRARLFLEDVCSSREGRRAGAATDWIHHAGAWLRYDGRRYVEVQTDDEMKHLVRVWSERRITGKSRDVVTGIWRPVRGYKSDTAVTQIVDAARGQLIIGSDGDEPAERFWRAPTQAGNVVRWDLPPWRRVDRSEGLPDPMRLISVLDGLVDVAAWVRGELVVVPHSPMLVQRQVAQVKLDHRRLAEANAGGRVAELARELAPMFHQWLEWAFEHSTPGWTDEAIRELAKWVGYVLTADTSKHHGNLLVITGASGTGKSVLAELIQAVVGVHNCVSTTISSMGSRFGLSEWRGKTLAVIPDLGNVRGDLAVEALERTKSITGQDRVLWEAKQRPAMTVRLMTRLLWVCNDLPQLPDHASALERRMICLPMRRKPEVVDSGLKDRLLAELEGIFIWGLQGLRWLHEDGSFAQPRLGADDAAEMAMAGSPALAWVQDYVIVTNDEADVVDTDELVGAYARHLEEQGSAVRPSHRTIQAHLRSAMIAQGWRGGRKHGPRGEAARTRMYWGVQMIEREAKSLLARSTAYDAEPWRNA